MKAIYYCFVTSLLALALCGCSTTHHSGELKPGSETVMITYHVKAGREAQLQALLLRAWEVYVNEHMVYPAPHVIVSNLEDGDKTRFVEIFTWSRSPDHAPASVKGVWEQEQSLCEARSGHRAIAGGEVVLVTGK